MKIAAEVFCMHVKTYLRSIKKSFILTCNIHSFARPIFSRYTTFKPFEFFSTTAPSQLSMYTKKVASCLLYPFQFFQIW